MKKGSKNWKRAQKYSAQQFFFSYSRNQLNGALLSMASILESANVDLSYIRPNHVHQIEIEQNRSDPAGKYGLLLFSIYDYPKKLHDMPEVYFQDQMGISRITCPSEIGLVFLRKFHFNTSLTTTNREIKNVFDKTQFWVYRESLAGNRLEQTIQDAGYTKTSEVEIPYGGSLALMMSGMVARPHSDSVFGIRQRMHLLTYAHGINIELETTPDKVKQFQLE